MTNQLERKSAWTGIAAVLFWIVGVIISESGESLGDNPSDQAVLSWVRANDMEILLGGWIFALGCVLFIWFIGTLRSRLMVAEGGTGMLASLAFGGGLATAIFLMAAPGGDMADAINKDDITAAVAGVLHRTGDIFFIGAELSAIILLVAVGAAALSMRVFPKWWAYFSFVLAVILVIGPIGWAALVFGMPIWIVGTSLMLARSRPVEREVGPV